MKNIKITWIAPTVGIGLLCSFSITAQNLITNGDFGAGLAGWSSTPNGTTTILYDAGLGNPPGSANLDRNNSTVADNGNYLYQIVPVSIGAQYQLSADWQGNLLNGGTGRNWAEVYINFGPSVASLDPTVNPGTILYKKATDGGPNDVPMPWTWEDITASPNGGPVDGIFTATDSYMLVAFNLGGRDQASNNTQPGFFNVDNVSLTPYPPISTPVFTNVMESGADILLQGTDGVPQGAYQVLRSDDVLVPMDNWSEVGIDTFDVNGGFSFTSALPADPASFYRLLLLSIGPVFPPGINTQPQSLARSVGQDAVFDVGASGTDLTYRWYYNTNTPLTSGSSSSLTLTNVQISDSGQYSVTVSNLLGTDESSFATLTVTNSTEPPGIAIQPSDKTGTLGQTAEFNVTATGALPLHYQWFYNTNTVLPGETNSTLTLLNVTTNQAGKYSVMITNQFGSTNSAFAALDVAQEVLAFPEAEGYGKYVTGGRGGAVYEVTTLNPTGTGSLGAAIGASGPRTVVFRVAGTITGNFSIRNDNITIAGQTAPGDGICIKGTFDISANNVIIRYIRVRNDPAANPDSDAFGGRFHENIMVDHVSASWSTDEVLSLYLNSNVTIQWSMITEACPKIVDGVNTGHRFGGIWGNNYGTYHHNLIAHNDSRNPRWASGGKFNDYRNNVLYNWGYNSCYGGEKVAVGSTEWTFFTVNMIANYYKYGPATSSGVRARIAHPDSRSSGDEGSWYVADNYVNGYPTVTANNWLGVDGSDYIQLNAPWPAMPINQQTPQDAYAAVLAHAGCSKPNRDSIDARIINEVANGTATYGNNGIITTPADVGGWPTLATGTPPTDTDHDGMPDDWENSHGLNPGNANDRNNVGPNGYTMLENYLNELGAF